MQIFAFPGNYSISETQIFAEKRRKPQISAENRRFLQKPVCPHLVLLFVLATRAAIYRSLRTLRARNRKKVSKRSFWGSAKKSPKKYLKKSKKYSKTSENRYFFLLFRVFFGTFLRTPKKTFFLRRFLVILGPEGPETPVNGGSGRKFVPFHSALLSTRLDLCCGVLGLQGGLPPHKPVMPWRAHNPEGQRYQ